MDLGLRNVVCLSGSSDRGRIAETAVFAELSRRGHDLFYWKSKGEVDFLCRGKGRTDALVQVADEIDDPRVVEREFGALEAAGRAHQNAKQTLVVGRTPETSVPAPPGIEVVPLWRYLLGDADS